MAINVSADPIILTVVVYSTRSTFPPTPRDPLLDQTFNCQADLDNPNIPEVIVSLLGDWSNLGTTADFIGITLSQLGSFIKGVVVDASPISITIGFKSADVVTEISRRNWLKWSNIGNLDFTIGRDNIAGERPIDWRGWIYEIRKLGNKAAAYGENGVSFLVPVGNSYQLQTVYRVGLYSAGAVTGTEALHFFIDKNGQLWKLGETLELLDYSEFFSSMGDLVMSYDTKNDLIYICDGTYGFIYSIKSKSLGKGPVNITGVGLRDDTLYVASSGADAIVTPTFEICTDIYDMGTRKHKTIKSIEVGTDLTEDMQASIDYRISNKLAFSDIGWHPVTLDGVAYMACYGLEFRFKLRVANYEYFEIDYLNINGFIHNYSYTEHTLRSGFEQR